jgi:hypothetical protein
MAALNGHDRVQQCEVFYCLVNGHGLKWGTQNSLTHSQTGTSLTACFTKGCIRTVVRMPFRF